MLLTVLATLAHAAPTAEPVEPPAREERARRRRRERKGDALGVSSVIAASGLAGGILGSSVGALNGSGDGAALGAVVGSAVGLGDGIAVAVSTPVPAGDGLAFASGVSLGLAYGLWTTTAVHGAWRTLDWQERDEAVPPAAGWRALGVLGGTAVGIYGMTRHPKVQDVLEVDTATYLGSGIALGTAGLLLYHPPEAEPVPLGKPGGTDPRSDYDQEASRQLAAAELAGATVGLATGALLHGRWRLGGSDVLFAGVLGAEGAWAGAYTPALLAVDRPEDLKGNVRLPAHALGAAGLLVADLADVGYGRALSTGFGAGVGNALGAGLPMVVGYDDQRSVAAWMVPLGLAGTAGGFLAEPLLRPTAGDAAFVGVSTALAGSAGMLVGEALDEQGAWVDSGQAQGLGLVATGVVGLGAYGLTAAVDPRVDRMLVVGAAGAWGAGYGALAPLAWSAEAGPATLLWSAAGTELAFAGASTLALRAGLEPRSTVVPQLLGLSGGTLGALFAGLATPETQPIAWGAMIGATAGFGIGAVAEALTPDRAPRGRALRSDAVVVPRFGHEPGANGPVPTVGLDVLGW